MKDELNLSYNGGVVAYLPQSVAIHFFLTLGKYKYITIKGSFKKPFSEIGD